MRVDAIADVSLLQKGVTEERHEVRLRDPRRGQEHRGGTVDLAVSVHPLAIDDVDRHLHGSRRLSLDRLVDGAGLQAS